LIKELPLTYLSICKWSRVSERNFHNVITTPINSINNIKESHKKKTPVINSLKRKTLIIKATIKNKAVILKRGSFKLSFYKGAGVSNKAL